MANLKRRNKAETVTKSPKIYDVDGYKYKSKTLANLHEEFKEYVQSNLIKSFTLPVVSDDNKKSKYGAKKVEIDGFIFDSAMEAKFYTYLLQLVRNDEIKSFERQVAFELQEKYKDHQTQKWIKAITYKADFVIINNDNQKVVIDIKGIETADFKLKKKMFNYKYRTIPLMCIRWESNKWKELSDIKKEKRQKNNIKETS